MDLVTIWDNNLIFFVFIKFSTECLFLLICILCLKYYLSHSDLKMTPHQLHFAWVSECLAHQSSILSPRQSLS